MSAMWMRAPIRTRTNLRARSPTRRHAASNAARTNRSGWGNPLPARRRARKRSNSVLPAEGDLIETLRPELFRRARDRAAAERAVEADRRLVVGQRPDDEAFQPA